MSKEDKKMAQHIVPCAHLERFTNNEGLLWVCREDDGRLKSYRLKPRTVCKQENYYDENPYDTQSNERSFKEIEDLGQISIDRVLSENQNGEIPDDIGAYAIHLIARTEAIRESITRSFSKAGNDLDDEEKRMLHAEIIKNFKENYLGENPRCLHCFIRTVLEPYYLLTSDIPVTVIGSCNPDSMKILKEYESPRTIEGMNEKPPDSWIKSMKDLVLAMPLTPNICLFIVNGDNEWYEARVSDPLDPRTIVVINTMMVMHRKNEVYSDRESKSLISQIQEMYSH